MCLREKANQIVYMFHQHTGVWQIAKECAILHVDEMLKEYDGTYIGYCKQVMKAHRTEKTMEWKQIRKEIENM